MKLLTQSQETVQVNGCQYQSKYGLLVARLIDQVVKKLEIT